MARWRRSKLWRYWGYIALGVLIIGVANAALGPAAILILTSLVILYSLFQAPVTCGAVNRTRAGGAVEYCRNNSSGLLLGCSVRNHKKQKFQSLFWGTRWHTNTAGLWQHPRPGSPP
jgi:hypothetical protein